MLNKEIRQFIKDIPMAIVASATSDGIPHLALGTDLKNPDEEHLVFENWFCKTTMKNVTQNPRVSVAIMELSTGTGYQFTGRVITSENTEILNGYLPGEEQAEQAQIRTRLVVQIEKVFAFCSGLHNDLLLNT